MAGHHAGTRFNKRFARGTKGPATPPNPAAGPLTRGWLAGAAAAALAGPLARGGTEALTGYATGAFFLSFALFAGVSFPVLVLARVLAGRRRAELLRERPWAGIALVAGLLLAVGVVAARLNAVDPATSASSRQIVVGAAVWAVWFAVAWRRKAG